MATLPQDPGPHNALSGVVPSDYAEREPDRWLVFGPTFVVACQAPTVDEAVALVLVRLGYAHRPWLADGLAPRHASRQEISAVCARRRVAALRVTSKNRRAVTAVARLVKSRDLRNSRDVFGVAHDGSKRGSLPPSRSRAGKPGKPVGSPA